MRAILLIVAMMAACVTSLSAGDLVSEVATVPPIIRVQQDSGTGSVMAIVVWYLTAPPGVKVKLADAPPLCSTVMPIEQAVAVARNGPQINTSWPIVVTDRMPRFDEVKQSCSKEPWGMKPLSAPQ